MSAQQIPAVVILNLGELEKSYVRRPPLPSCPLPPSLAPALLPTAPFSRSHHALKSVCLWTSMLSSRQSARAALEPEETSGNRGLGLLTQKSSFHPWLMGRGQVETPEPIGAPFPGQEKNGE